jgi:geranylgeranyl diphosphate synthase type I
VTDLPAPPSSLLDIARRVEARLDAFLGSESERWGAVDADLVEPMTALRGLLLSGGKRLRPAFCHWAYVGAGGADEARSTDAGAALELLHGFALIHDDVMDGSDRRRGRATIHRAFAERHVQGAWGGEDRRFGEGVAILVGDLAFVYADRLLGEVPPPARRVWDELRTELNIGQYLDLVGTARRDIDLEGARRIATYKSGKYTVERPLHLGAALAGRLDELAEPMTAYGLPLGEAFQLRDDLLGAFGDAETIGKPVGDDLREGKPTPLLAIAAARAGDADRALLARVGDRDLGDADIAAIGDVLERTGAVAEIEDRIETLTDEARRAAKALRVDWEVQQALADLATYAAQRDR